MITGVLAGEATWLGGYYITFDIFDAITLCNGAPGGRRAGPAGRDRPAGRRVRGAAGPKGRDRPAGPQGRDRRHRPQGLGPRAGAEGRRRRRRGCKLPGWLLDASTIVEVSASGVETRQVFCVRSRRASATTRRRGCSRSRAGSPG